jgi:glycosyltransferase involved in cell wall biosynthesis
MKIIFASHTFIGGTFAVGSHHLARAISAAGHDVLHIATPITPLHFVLPRSPDRVLRRRLCLTGLHETDGRVLQWVPLSWIRTRIFGHDLTLRTMWPTARQVLLRAGFASADVLLIDQPAYAGLWRYMKVRRVVYRPTDVYPAIDPRPGVRQSELEVLRRADDVIATSEPVAEHVRMCSERTVPIRVLENGVEFNHFATPVPPPHRYGGIPAPRVVYVGALDVRFDWEAVRAAAVRLPDVSFVLIGPRAQRIEQMDRPSNLHALGPQPYGSIAGYLQHASVGLLPMTSHQANAGRSPMKLYEYTAAGLHVVARRTPELARRALPTLTLYDDGADLAQAVQAALSNPTDRGTVAALARPFDWAGRAARLLQWITPEVSDPVGQRQER